MQDKNKLKKLIQIIGDLIKIEGNEWLVNELLQIIGNANSFEEVAKHSVIQNIHEYCVEEKINKQAIEFYKSFPIDVIIEQLVIDFVKMEHERRRDDFENFCLCLYQQIENITNYLFDNYFIGDWNLNQTKPVLTDRSGKTITQYDLIVGNSPDWYANTKFKAVLYYYYYSENLKTTFQFNEKLRVFDEIYQVRNQNHRGNVPKEYQKKILDKIQGNESKYYFKFYGFLQDFVGQIENTIQNSPLQNMPKSEVNEAFNALADNTDLANLLQKLKTKE